MNNVSLTQVFKGEWLEYIPTDWKQSKIKHLFSIKKNIAGELGHDVISITQRGAKLKDIESGEGQLAMDYSKYQLVTEGDFLMNHMDLLTGYVDISKFNGVTSPDYRVFSVSNENAYSKYFLYLFQHGYKSKIFYAYGRGSSQLGRWRFPTVEFEDFHFPIPPIEEQKLISRYLDKKTSQIDSLVEKIQKKIKLLKEQRTSLINHYVTKGLDPNVEMKDSGIEWIGEIPKHWKIIKTNLISENLDGRRVPLNAVERDSIKGDIPYWGSNNIVDYINDYIFDETLVLVGEDGSPFFERDKPVSFVTSGKVWINNHIHVLRPKENVISEWLSESFNIVDYKEFITGSTRDKLTQSDLNRIPHVVPPIDEQRLICSTLLKRTELINKIIKLESIHIEKLKEYRQSLISSVVTGKVRVTEDMV